MSNPVEPASQPSSAAGRSRGEAAAEDRAFAFDEPSEPYTRQRFLREAAVAVAILAVGLPLVLLLAPDSDGGAGVGADVLAPPLATAPATPTVSTSPADTSLDPRPVHVVTADLSQAVSERVAQTASAASGATSTTALAAGKGFTSVQPSLGTLAVQSLPTGDLAMVVVQAGAGDVGGAPGTTQAGAELVVIRLRGAVTGSTSVTLVGPVPQGEPTAALLRVRDEIRAAATAKGVRFVDPVAVGLRLDQPDLATRLGAAVGVYVPPAGS